MAEALTSHYASYYDGQWEWRELGAVDKVDNIVRLWEGPPPNMVDIGCGEGAIAAELAKRQFPASYVGAEVSESAIDAARGRGLPVQFELFDGTSLPFGDDSFDLAVLSHVVEHLEHPRALLVEAKRVARHVFVEVPLELRWRTPHDFVWTDTGHINLYNRTVIRHLVQSVGLTVLSERLSNPSRAVIEMSAGRRGSVQWATRELALRLASRVATGVFTYHFSLLARS